MNTDRQKTKHQAPLWLGSSATERKRTEHHHHARRDANQRWQYGAELFMFDEGVTVPASPV